MSRTEVSKYLVQNIWKYAVKHYNQQRVLTSPNTDEGFQFTLIYAFLLCTCVRLV